MAEALILAVSGTVMGVAWSLLGIYLSSLVIAQYPPAAYAIRGIFLAVAALFHGFIRSRTPRLFVFVLLLIIICVVTLVSTTTTVTTAAATQILYPILIAAGCITLINLCIFPEFSSRFLGQTTIDTLCDTAKALEDAGRYFIEAENYCTASNLCQESTDKKLNDSSLDRSLKDSPKGKSTSTKLAIYGRLEGIIKGYLSSKSARKGDGIIKDRSRVSLTRLTDSKAQIRKKLAECKAAQQECNFELAVSVLPPRDMKLISVTAMKKMVANTVAVIGACESKFALLGDREDTEGDHSKERVHDSGKTKAIADNEMGKSHNGDDIHSSLNEASSEEFVLHQDKAELQMIKPRREIEFGDARLLKDLLRRVAKPYEDLHKVIARTVEIVAACLAYTYVRSSLLLPRLSIIG